MKKWNKNLLCKLIAGMLCFSLCNSTTVLADESVSETEYEMQNNNISETDYGAQNDSTSETTYEIQGDSVLTADTNNSENGVAPLTTDTIEDLSATLSDIDTESDIEPLDDVEVVSLTHNAQLTGDFNDANQENSYKISVDFSEINAVAFCLVRTGFTNASMSIYNDAGEKIITKNLTDKQAKTWYYVNKPEDASGSVVYTVIVKPINYSGKSSSYCLSIGNKEEVESLMGNIQNTVPLESYQEANSNFVSLTYTPNKAACYFRFTAEIDTTITILSKSSNLRFRVVSIDNNNIIYDSKDHTDTHKTKFVGTSWTCAEKVKDAEELVAGTEYYLVVYNISPKADTLLDTKNFLVAVGKPVMGAGTTKLYPNRNVRMRSNAYTVSSFNIDNSAIPNTAQIKSVSVNGVLAKNIANWRVMPPNKRSWTTSASRNPQIDMNFVKDSTLNAYVQGNWQVGFKAAKDATTTTFTPYYSVSYYYEYGD